MKKRFLVLGLSAVMLFSALTVSAAEFVFPTKDGGSVNITEELKNVYTAGNTVSINANVRGSLHAAGSMVILRGNVSGTMYAGAGNVIIEGSVGEDLFIGGGSVVLAESSYVGGDLVVGAGQIAIDGPVTGNIIGGAGEMTINSRVSGNVKVEAGNLILGDKAEIIGDLEYTAEKEINLDRSKISGQVIFNQKESLKAGVINPKLLIGLLTLGILLKLLGLIAIGLIFAYLLKKFTQEIVERSLEKFWPNLGIGFAGLILIPVAMIILAISVIGLWLAGILMAFYGLFMALALAIASIILGVWLMKLLTKKKNYVFDWKAVVVGVIGMKILIWIPFIGWLAKLILFLMALGSVIQWFYKKIVKA